MRKSTKKLNIAIKYDIPLDLSLQKTLKDAVIKRDYASVKRLLENGANPNEQDSEGLTALHFAAKDNRVVIANLLLHNGASIMIKDNEGHTSLDYALIFNYDPLINLFSKKLTNAKDKNFCSFFAHISSESESFEPNTSQLNFCR